MSKQDHWTRNCKCALCDAKIPKRVTYLYEEELGGWICKDCWNLKYDKLKALSE